MSDQESTDFRRGYQQGRFDEGLSWHQEKLREQARADGPEILRDGSDGGPILVRYEGNATISTVTKSSDPASILLRDGHRSTPTVHRRGCYICEDPEFALMGLPLCKPCPRCQLLGSPDPELPDGHVAADDCGCDACGLDVQDWYFGFAADITACAETNS